MHTASPGKKVHFVYTGKSMRWKAWQGIFTDTAKKFLGYRKVECVFFLGFFFLNVVVVVSFFLKYTLSSVIWENHHRVIATPTLFSMFLSPSFPDWNPSSNYMQLNVFFPMLLTCFLLSFCYNYCEFPFTNQLALFKQICMHFMHQKGQYLKEEDLCSLPWWRAISSKFHHFHPNLFCASSRVW